ncbi:MAG: GNAT family N-acetyltransferase [Minicystis sp.]
MRALSWIAVPGAAADHAASLASLLRELAGDARLAARPAAERWALGADLERLLARRTPADDPDLPFWIGVVAMEIGDWGLAAEALRRDLRESGASAAAWSNLGRCAWELGRCADAEAAFARALACETGAVATARALHTVRSFRRRCAAIPWWSPERASDGEVLLEPMGEKHALGFWQQCRGASVIERTPLPAFGSPEEVAAHVAALAARADLVTFAIVQRRFGFVGEIALERRARDQADLSFWIGEDFQGRGHGRRAARIALALARRMGIRDVIAEVAADNRRSLAALVAAGAAVIESDASRCTLSLRPVGSGEEDDA